MQSRENYITSTELQTQERILTSIFAKNDTITLFDIGACEGESSVRYSRLFPNASIYTFEPLPNNFSLVHKNIEQYQTKNIHPIQLCLSDKSGETEFYVSSGKPENASDEDWNYGNKSSSMLPPTSKNKELHSWIKFEESITVKTETLDSFCSTNKIQKIDFIHMDVQGAELMVLKGATNRMQNINAIWLEVEAVELYKGQPLKDDIEQFLTQNNFIKIEDTVYTTAGDQFWVRKSFIKYQKGYSFVWFRQLSSNLKFYYKRIRRSLLK